MYAIAKNLRGKRNAQLFPQPDSYLYGIHGTEQLLLSLQSYNQKVKRRGIEMML